MAIPFLVLGTLLAFGPGQFVEGPRGRIHVDVRGQGERTLVFVHGTGGRGTQWEGQLSVFSAKHRVVALDLPGMGASEAPRQGGYGVAALAEDLQAVFEALKIERAVLVAHSYGGAVALSLAGRLPSRVEGVFLVDVAGDVRAATVEARKAVQARLAPEAFDAARFDKLIDQAFPPILVESRPEIQEQVLAQAHGTAKAAFLGALAGLQDFDPGPVLGTFPGPVWNLFTERLGPEARIDLQFPRVQGSPMRGVSHWPMLDRPQEFNGRLKAFLDAVRPELRQFDFWVGDWEVRDAKGQFLGTNRVHRTLGGMALQENWEGSKGGMGKSFNAWQPGNGKWRQTWVDQQGNFLDLEGGLEGKAMVMRGLVGGVQQRITWTPLEDGRIRQVWETSADGKAWAGSFDGFYQRRRP